jgi:hypothetical protein
MSSAGDTRENPDTREMRIQLLTCDSVAIVRMNLDGKPLGLQLALRAAAIAGLGGRLRLVHGFAGTWPRRLGSETSFGRGLALVNEFGASAVG